MKAVGASRRDVRLLIVAEGAAGGLAAGASGSFLVTTTVNVTDACGLQLTNLAVITVWAVLILSAGLARTGVAGLTLTTLGHEGINVLCVVSSSDATVVDGGGRTLMPGLIDMHVHLREPGKAEEETIASGSAAAVAGAGPLSGYTIFYAVPEPSSCILAAIGLLGVGAGLLLAGEVRDDEAAVAVEGKSIDIFCRDGA